MGTKPIESTCGHEQPRDTGQEGAVEDERAHARVTWGQRSRAERKGRAFVRASAGPQPILFSRAPSLSNHSSIHPSISALPLMAVHPCLLVGFQNRLPRSVGDLISRDLSPRTMGGRCPHFQRYLRLRDDQSPQPTRLLTCT